MSKVVDVILLNWNASHDTVLSFEKIMCLSYLPDKIVIVDNASEIEDYNYLVDYFKKSYIFSKKSTNYAELLISKKVVIVRSIYNKGYAGGNNLGIKISRELNNPDFFWILNNDTQPHVEAFKELLLVADENIDSFVSSVTLSFDGLIEAYGGGRYYPILGKSKLLHKRKKYSPCLPISINYLMGASLLVPKSIVDDVGLMDECFFMYSEEIDWQWRAINKGYKIQVAPKSIVYHAGSSSTESYQYHFYRNRAAIMFNSIYFGCLYSIVSGLVLSVYTAVRYAFKPKLVIFGIKGCFQGVCKKRKDKMLPL